MTAPLFRVISPAGNLVADRYGFGLNYLGKATLVATAQPTNDGQRGDAGYSTYSFTAPSALIVPFFSIPAGRTVFLKSMLYSAGAWIIQVYCGATPNDSLGMQTQYGDVEVFVFGRLTTASGVGLKMRDDAGVLTHVFTDTDGRPLYPVGRLTVADADLSMRSIPVLTKPAVCGFPGAEKFTSESVGGGFYRNRIWEYGWVAGTNAIGMNGVVDIVERDDTPLTAIPPGLQVFVANSTETFIIEANGLT